MFTLRVVSHDGSFDFRSIESLQFDGKTSAITYDFDGEGGEVNTSYAYADLINSDGTVVNTVWGPKRDQLEEPVLTEGDYEDNIDHGVEEATDSAGNVVPLTEDAPAPAVPPMAPGVAGDVVTSTPR